MVLSTDLLCYPALFCPFQRRQTPFLVGTSNALQREVAVIDAYHLLDTVLALHVTSHLSGSFLSTESGICAGAETQARLPIAV